MTKNLSTYLAEVVTRGFPERPLRLRGLDAVAEVVNYRQALKVVTKNLNTQRLADF